MVPAAAHDPPQPSQGPGGSGGPDGPAEPDGPDRPAGSDRPAGPTGPGGPGGRRGPLSGTAGVGTQRIEAFSDGVFAIAITLLVLNFSIAADLGDDQVWPAITDQAPKLLSAGISFVVIGMYWIGHNATFRWIDRSSGRLTVVNLAHLATIVFLPFPTLVLAEYSDSFAGVALYAATLALTGFTAAVVTWTAWTQGLMAPEVDRAWVMSRISGLCSTPAVFTVSIVVALVSPAAATYFWILAIVAARPTEALIRRIVA
jgi:uncharacterized membrane protein